MLRNSHSPQVAYKGAEHCAPQLMREATKMPTVQQSWKRMLKPPRYFGGAISMKQVTC